MEKEVAYKHLKGIITPLGFDVIDSGSPPFGTIYKYKTREGINLYVGYSRDDCDARVSIYPKHVIDQPSHSMFYQYKRDDDTLIKWLEYSIFEINLEAI